MDKILKFINPPHQLFVIDLQHWAACELKTHAQKTTTIGLGLI